MTEQEKREETAVTSEVKDMAGQETAVTSAVKDAAGQEKELISTETDIISANAITSEESAGKAASLPQEKPKASEDAAISAQEKPEASEDAAISAQEEPKASEDAAISAQEPDEDKEDTRDRMFTLRFKIPLEDYLSFYRLMTAGDELKNKKKMTIVGAIEIAVGLIYLVTALTGAVQASVFTYVVCLMLLLMGAYGMTYYKYFYQGSLTRSVTKQYDKTPYFHSTMEIDFYPNRSIEHIGDKRVENLWSKIDSIKVSETAYMIMVDPKRCMLIPKGQISGQIEKMESLVKLICENYEKPRYDV